MNSKATIVVAGATGALGGRIVRSLIERGTDVRAVVRRGAEPQRLAELRRRGATLLEADLGGGADLAAACAGGACVVSALSGLGDVIVDGQTALLEAAVRAGVPRFIPSDYSIDFRPLPDGSNRNLDLRRRFHERLDRAAIAATSIFNGMFTDLLLGPAPILLPRLRLVLYWEDADRPLDFTTMDDTAAFTAAAALDAAAPRTLHIAGDRISPRGLAAVASEVTGARFRLVRAGGLGRLEALIRITRALSPASEAVYPPWQGMQYLQNMFSGLVPVGPLDNDRYPGLRWTRVRDALAARQAP